MLARRGGQVGVAVAVVDRISTHFAPASSAARSAVFGRIEEIQSHKIMNNYKLLFVRQHFIGWYASEA